MMPTDVSLDKCRLRTIGSRILATLSCLESLAIAHLPPCDASPNVQMQVFQPAINFCINLFIINHNYWARSLIWIEAMIL